MLQNYLANNIVDILSFWVFTDIFEEGGMYPDPYSTGFMPVDGLMNVYGIPKPSYRYIKREKTKVRIINTLI